MALVANDLEAGLVLALERAGIVRPTGLVRLTGGATMESWRFAAGGINYILRRAPSFEFLAERPFSHNREAAVICTAHANGVTAPEVVAQLEPEDGIGSGFVMKALPGTPDPKSILAMDEPDRLLAECAGQLARIHNLPVSGLPADLPRLEPAKGVAKFCDQFDEAGGDRPIIALGLRWLQDHIPEPVEPVLNHGDYRLGNLLVQNSRLTGVLDWELAHLSDWHEDLAFGCMTVWRFARIDRPALGLGTQKDYFEAYRVNGGRPVDPGRFRFWLIYRTVWWALGCLRMGAQWRSGADRSLERAVISRRTSEQELDLLMLLEEEAPQAERETPLPSVLAQADEVGHATVSELATAISEWLVTVKPQMEGHDRFQHAVARNALGLIAREASGMMMQPDRALSDRLLNGRATLAGPGLLAALRRRALDAVAIDMPKYPSLAAARAKWTGEP